MITFTSMSQSGSGAILAQVIWHSSFALMRRAHATHGIAGSSGAIVSYLLNQLGSFCGEPCQRKSEFVTIPQTSLAFREVIAWLLGGGLFLFISLPLVRRCGRLTKRATNAPFKDDDRPRQRAQGHEAPRPVERSVSSGVRPRACAVSASNSVSSATSWIP